MESNRFRGTGTALVTPFLDDGRVNMEAVEYLAERQINAGVNMLVPCGTTGEAVTLDPGEYRSVVAAVVGKAAGRAVVVAGAGSNSTAKTIENARIARDCGADAVLVVAPYYNKPSQEGLFRHYEAVAESVDLPIVIYNVPGRTGCNMSAETQLRIACLPNIVATKEASGNVSQIMRIIAQRPSSFSVLSGDDNLTLPLISAGADGVISTIANETPKDFADLVSAALAGDFRTARRLHYRLLDLMEINFIESNPLPVKAAMSLMGLIEENYRLPLTPVSEVAKEKIRSVLERMGLIS